MRLDLVRGVPHLRADGSAGVPHVLSLRLHSRKLVPDLLQLGLQVGAFLRLWYSEGGEERTAAFGDEGCKANQYERMPTCLPSSAKGKNSHQIEWMSKIDVSLSFCFSFLNRNP